MSSTNWKARALAAEAELQHLDRVLARWPALAECASRTDAVVLACCLEGVARQQVDAWQSWAQEARDELRQRTAHFDAERSDLLHERRAFQAECSRLRRLLTRTGRYE